MKILKKIGLVCLVALICFTATIHKVSAYTINGNNQLIKDETYYLYLNPDFDWDGQSIGVIYYGSDSYSLIIEGYGYIFVVNDYNDYEWGLNYIGDYSSSDGLYYNVYSFVPTITCTFDGYDFSQNVGFIETNYLSTHNGIYGSIYTIVERYLFGGIIQPNSYQELTATLLSGTICILTFALPFLIIWKVIRLIMG